MKNKVEENNLNIRYIFIFVLLIIIIISGIFVLVGWIIGNPYLSNFGVGIPVAPSTALFFLLFGTIFFIRIKNVGNRKVYQITWWITFFGGLLSLLFLFLSTQNIYLEFEHFFIPINHVPGKDIIGHMSLISASCLTLTSIIFLLIPFSISQSNRFKIAWILAGLLSSIGVFLVLAYLFGVPVLYGTKYVPPAVLTSITIFFLGLALIGLSFPSEWITYLRNNFLLSKSLIYLGLFLILTLSIFITGYYSYISFEKQFLIQQKERLNIIAELKVNNLIDWRKEQMLTAEYLHQNKSFSLLVKKYLENQDNQTLFLEVHDWLNNALLSPQIDQARLLDLQGKTILSSPTDLISIDSIPTYEIEEIAITKEVKMVDFHRREPDGRIHISIVIPILDTNVDETILAFVLLSIDPYVDLYPFIQEWPSESLTAETLLVRKEGSYVLFLNDLRFQPNAAMRLRISLDHTDLPAVKAVNGEIGAVEGIDYRDEEVIASLKPVPNSPWFLVARMDTSEVYIPLQRRIWQTIMITILGILVSGAGPALLWREQQINFYRKQIESSQILNESQKALKKVQQRYELIKTSLNDGIYDWDLITNEIYYSPSWKSMLGYTDDELANDFSVWEKLIRPADMEKSWAMQNELINKKRDLFELEFKMKHKEGHWVDILSRATALFNDAGEAVKVIGTHVDISELNEAKIKLMKTEHDLQTTFDVSPSIIAQLNITTGYFIKVNNAVNRILGYSIEEFLSKPYEEIIHPNDIEKFGIVASMMFDGQKITSFENRCLCKDGSYKWLSWQGNLTDESNIMTTIASDINEKKILQVREIELEANLRQQQKLEAIGTLASGVAHEINNPINGIMNYAQLIYDRLDGKDSKLQDFSNEIIKETARVTKIVSNLLSFSRHEKQSHSPALMVDIINDTLSLITTIIRTDQIILEVNIPDNLPKIKCRSQQIQQVLMNLLTNARDALNDRYPEYNENKKIMISVNQFNFEGRRWLRTIVEDHGIGIPEEIQDQIFDHFFTTKDRTKGTGLGLSISFEIIKEHHGTLDFEVIENQGTRFFFDLPIDNGWEID